MRCRTKAVQDSLAVLFWKVHVQDEQIKGGRLRFPVQPTYLLNHLRAISDDMQFAVDAVRAQRPPDQIGVCRVVFSEYDFEAAFMARTPCACWLYSGLSAESFYSPKASGN